MVDLTGVVVQVRAQRAAWRGQGRLLRERLGKSRHVLVSAALVVAGLAGALGGGALIGRWCLGLVLLAESAGAIWVGLNRDDGGRAGRGGRTPLDAAREHVRGLP